MKIAEQVVRFIQESVKDSIKKLYGVSDEDFEKAEPSHSVCSIVKTKEGWAGFSHRAAHEFKIGDMLFDEKWDDNGKLSDEELCKMPFKERGSEKIKTLEQAKQAAKNFARSVS